MHSILYPLLEQLQLYHVPGKCPFSFFASECAFVNNSVNLDDLEPSPSVRLRFMVHGSRVTVHGSLFMVHGSVFYGSFAWFRSGSEYDNRMLHRRRVPEGAAGTERAWRETGTVGWERE